MFAITAKNQTAKTARMRIRVMDAKTTILLREFACLTVDVERQDRKKENRMAEYHVGCGIAGIYAGTVKKKKKDEWQSKSEVTDEAIKAVTTWMFNHITEGETAYAYAMKTYNDKYLRLKVEVLDECPEWAKDVLEGEQE